MSIPVNSEGSVGCTTPEKSENAALRPRLGPTVHTNPSPKRSSNRRNLTENAGFFLKSKMAVAFLKFARSKVQQGLTLP